jgi:secretion/DNA translocation related TadE-like protein
VLTATVMLVLVAAAVVAFTLASWVACLHRARSAADLAALAGAAAYRAGGDACAAASVSAVANNTTPTGCAVQSNGIDFLVRVTVSAPIRPRLPFGPPTVESAAQAGALG